MRLRSLPFLLCILLFFCSCRPSKELRTYDNGKGLVVKKLSDHVYQHVSFLQTESFGKVPCNGMIVFDQNEAIVFDTPVSDSASEALIEWIGVNLKCKVKAVIATHFHEDCVGGLRAFHARGIPSYALHETIALAKSHDFQVPQIGFDQRMEFKVGNQLAIAEYNGAGHTPDNIVGYFPSEKALFGGCLIKELKAGKGYLGDARVSEWSATVEKVKAKYGEAKVVIPGHGETGGVALLDYTIGLFKEK